MSFLTLERDTFMKKRFNHTKRPDYNQGNSRETWEEYEEEAYAGEETDYAEEEEPYDGEEAYYAEEEESNYEEEDYY